MIVGDMFIEFVVLFLADIVFITRPQRRRLIDGLVLIGDFVFFFLRVPLFFFHHNGQGDVVGIFTNDGFQLPSVE